VNQNQIARFLLCLIGVILDPCAARTSQAAEAVVTTTLIETAMRDLLGNDITIIRLMPPGSCPGHFDLQPADAQSLASAILFVRHDFQAGLDAGVVKSGLESNRIVTVSSRSAFTIPGEYAAMCEELADRLAATWPERAARIAARLFDVRQRARFAEASITERAKRLRGRKVLCAYYQRDFCRWIGLSVVAVFHAGTDESAWQLSRAVDMAMSAQAEAVIGNRQWGPRHLDALAEATGLPGIMLSNFPESGDAGAYWRLLDANVNALLEGLR